MQTAACEAGCRAKLQDSLKFGAHGGWIAKIWGIRSMVCERFELEGVGFQSGTVKKQVYRGLRFFTSDIPGPENLRVSTRVPASARESFPKKSEERSCEIQDSR